MTQSGLYEDLKTEIDGAVQKKLQKNQMHLIAEL